MLAPILMRHSSLRKPKPLPAIPGRGRKPAKLECGDANLSRPWIPAHALARATGMTKRNFTAATGLAGRGQNIQSRAHDSEKHALGPDRGWEPVFGPGHVRTETILMRVV